MVATQVLISLCVAGLAVAAPQLDLPGVQRTVTTVAVNDVNEDTLVTSVVSALEPSIALAVANALRSLQTTTTTTSGGAVIGGGASSGQSSSSSFSASSAANSASSAAKSSASAANAKSSSTAAEKAAFEREFASRQANEEPTTRPEYNFEFKVADGEEQTYITQQESRDGDQLTGSYSYVDPEGALITVNYQAGPEGFSQTTDKQEGFIQIVPRPPRIVANAAGASSASSSSGKFPSTASGGSKGGASFSSQTATSSSSTLDQSALIAQILAALQPQISASVNAALTASQSRTTSSVINVPAAPIAVAAAPVAQSASRPAQKAASGNVASLFGDGFAVRIATPEFKIEY